MKRGGANWPVGVLLLLTLAGLALRLRQYGFSLFGDELSTLWVVRDHGLRESLDLVSGNAEITPPLYFALAWFTTRLGEAPELVRLPALLAGTALIPLTGLLGRVMFNWPAGLAAALLVTLSPSMIYFSGNGRAYSVMLLCLVLATLAMLLAARGGSTWWWPVYGASALLAMYSHYTAVFVLAAGFLWLLWAFPGSRRPALVTAGAATLLFLPWLGGLIRDLGSPTIELLEALQSDGVAAQWAAFRQWSLGHPLFTPAALPGTLAALLVAAAVLVAAGRLAFSRTAGRGPGGPSEGQRMAILAVGLALATPVATALLGLAGTELFSARNLTASWPGLALALGGLLAAIGPAWGLACGAVLLAGLGIGTVKALDPGRADPGYGQAARMIEARPGPGGPVIDVLAPPVSPSPLTPLGLYLEPGTEVIRVNHPEGPPPFLAFTPPVPPPAERIGEALDGKRAALIVGPSTAVEQGSGDAAGFADGVVTLPRGWRVESVETVPGRINLTVTEVRRER